MNMDTKDTVVRCATCQKPIARCAWQASGVAIAGFCAACVITNAVPRNPLTPRAAIA